MNHSFPANIFCYRNDVSLDQLQNIRDNELNILNETIQRKYSGNIKLVFIAVANFVNTLEVADEEAKTFLLVDQNAQHGKTFLHKLKVYSLVARAII